MIPRYFNELLRVSITLSYAISRSGKESLILKGKQISTGLLGLICNLLATHHFLVGAVLNRMIVQAGK